MGNAPKRKTTATRKRPAQQSTQAAASRSVPWGKIGAGVGVLAAIALAVFIGTGSGPATIDGAPEGAENVDFGPPSHVEGEIAHPPGDNPAGGPHNPIWLNCGIYDTPVPSENAVHSLEHGAVWITYSDIAEDEVETLRSVASRRQRVIVSPEPEQAAPIRLSAWNWILEVDDADDPRVVQFMNEFESSPTNTPEPGASCQGGVGSPIA